MLGPLYLLILIFVTCSHFNIWAISSSSTTLKPRALVIGGSLSGLITARSLSDFYDVVVLEKDSDETLAPEGDVLKRLKSRSSVPQGRHIHVLLAKGAQILEDLFPGIQSELEGSGGDVVDWPGVYANNIDGKWFARDLTAGKASFVCSFYERA